VSREGHGSLRLPVPGADLSAEIPLPSAALRYLTVRRAGPGTALVVFDGRGHEVAATLVLVGETLVARPTEAPRAGLAGQAVHLWYGLPKGDKLDAVIRDVTELGVGHIQLLACRRSVVKLEGDRVASRMERLERIAAEAARQCGRADVPVIEAPRSVAQALAEHAGGSLLVLHPDASARSFSEIALVAPTTVCVGPEGGFAPEELAAFEQAGALRVKLHAPVLRTETAAPVACALALHRLGLL
jgi:16S rRNA (uracil1498-N3)-methyltransferase